MRLISLNKSRRAEESKQKKEVVRLNKFPVRVLEELKGFVEGLVPVEDVESIVVLSRIVSQVSNIEQVKRLHRVMASEFLGVGEDNI